MGRQLDRPNTAIRIRDARIAPEASSPNGGRSRGDCDGHAVDARNQGLRPNRDTHPNDNSLFCEEYLPLAQNASLCGPLQPVYAFLSTGSRLI